MKRFINYLKERKFFVVFTLVVLSATFFFHSETVRIEQERNKTGIKYKNITPGLTDKDSVIKELGEPASKVSKDNESALWSYNTKSANRKNEVVYEKDTVVFVKEIITLEDKINYNTLTQNHGEPEYKLNGPGSYNGFYLYAYVSKGIAFIANPVSGTVIEIWYFPPTTLDTFLNTWAVGYTEGELPPKQ